MAKELHTFPTTVKFLCDCRSVCVARAFCAITIIATRPKLFFINVNYLLTLTQNTQVVPNTINLELKEL